MAEGRWMHKRLEAEPKKPPEDEHRPVCGKEMWLTAPGIGITCRIDLLVGDGIYVIPVDYKRGSAPGIPEGAYEPDRVQVCAQGLVLRENGYKCNEGAIFFLKSKTRVQVQMDDATVQRTKELLENLRAVARDQRMPPPLKDSPKCSRCSLGGICLPDEINMLNENALSRDPENEVRMLLPSRDDQVPIYVAGQGSTIRKRGDCLEVWSLEGKVDEARLLEISQVNIYGGVEITTPAMEELMQRGVPVLHFTHGGWFLGICQGTVHKNIEVRIRQFDWAADKEKCLQLARSFVSGKIRNCRTLLMRNNPEVPQNVLVSLCSLSREAEAALSIESLRGFEGAAAEAYFSAFPGFLKSKTGEYAFVFTGRNKRPPRDPVNAVLSYLYGILAKELFVTVQAVGFDPYLGFYHQPRYGRPALALDLMEEFRPIIADSTAITLFNKLELSSRDFIVSGIGVAMKPEAKRKVVAGYERRIQTEVIHPVFNYSVSYRRVLEIQARLLARHLHGEIENYPAFITK